ncbi:MAG: hypothetical protein U0667_19115, partial [Chloroflexota bacterium]
PGWDVDPDALGPFRADVGLMAHVGYDIERIGPVLDALEGAALRLCIAVMGEGAMTTVGRLYWEPTHGEPRVPLPALPDFLALLVARDRLPEVRLVERETHAFPDLDALHDAARRQLWLRPGSERDALLRRMLERDAVPTEGGVALPEDRSRIGIISWVPR